MSKPWSRSQLSASSYVRCCGSFTMIYLLQKIHQLRISFSQTPKRRPPRRGRVDNVAHRATPRQHYGCAKKYPPPCASFVTTAVRTPARKEKYALNIQPHLRNFMLCRLISPHPQVFII